MSETFPGQLAPSVDRFRSPERPRQSFRQVKLRAASNAQAMLCAGFRSGPGECRGAVVITADVVGGVVLPATPYAPSPAGGDPAQCAEYPSGGFIGGSGPARVVPDGDQAPTIDGATQSLRPCCEILRAPRRDDLVHPGRAPQTFLHHLRIEVAPVSHATSISTVRYSSAWSWRGCDRGSSRIPASTRTCCANSC